MDWNQQQYEKFRAAREQPFDDVVALIRPAPALRIVDLGCGPGNLTQKLAARFPDAAIVGIDSSPAMLDKARALAVPRASFVAASIEAFADAQPIAGADGEFDVIFSNAALHWVAD
ncbi:MAG TPA: methyltransferase domain-containing protein, partial [Polyangia bacterium]